MGNYKNKYIHISQQVCHRVAVEDDQEILVHWKTSSHWNRSEFGLRSFHKQEPPSGNSEIRERNRCPAVTHFFQAYSPESLNAHLPFHFILSPFSSGFPLGKRPPFGTRMSGIWMQFPRQTVGGVETPRLPASSHLWKSQATQCEKSHAMGQEKASCLRKRDWNRDPRVSVPP